MKVYICEQCQNSHDGSYGSGRFCSKHCRFVFIGKQTKKHVCNFNKYKKHKRSAYGTWKCERCNLVFETRAQLFAHNHEVHPVPKGTSWNKGLTKESDPRIAKYVQTNLKRGTYGKIQRGKHLSTEHRAKTSSSLKNFYKNHPERIPYKLHHSSKESYPEKYFNELLIKENITGFEREYYVDGYYLDFAFLDKKLDLEIDGSQHYVDPKIVEHDKKRTKYLKSIGWKIFRIDWRLWQKLSASERKLKIDELKTLLQLPK